jgi:hypothetical protein
MATYAMMSGNTVSNVIVADDKETTEAALGCVLIEYTPENPAGTGWVFDPDTGRFDAPVVVEGPIGLTETPAIEMVNGAEELPNP